MSDSTDLTVDATVYIDEDEVLKEQEYRKTNQFKLDKLVKRDD